MGRNFKADIKEGECEGVGYGHAASLSMNERTFSIVDRRGSCFPLNKRGTKDGSPSASVPKAVAVRPRAFIKASISDLNDSTMLMLIVCIGFFLFSKRKFLVSL